MSKNRGEATPRLPFFYGVLWVQGLFYFCTAAWPILSIRTFQLVTGPKTDHMLTGNEGDHWLVNTVAVLLLASSLVYLTTAFRKTLSFEVVLLLILNAVALTVIDVVYVGRDVIRPVYLLDAAVEVVFIVIWCIYLIYQKREALHGKDM